MQVNEEGYLISVGNQEIFIVPMENFPLHNMVYIKPIVTTQGNHPHVTRVVPNSFTPRRFIVTEPYVDVPICLATSISSHNIIITKSIPPYLGGDLLTILNIKKTLVRMLVYEY
jgi:hypothetical protein